MKNRVVLQGGVWSNQAMLEPWANAVSKTFDVGVDIFGFRETSDENGQLKLERAAKDRLVLTHSAGHLALTRTMRPAAVVGYNAPLPRSSAGLIARSLPITVEHFVGSLPGQPHPEGDRNFLLTTRHEILPPQNAYGNLRRLGAIARHNAFTHAMAMQSAGIPNMLVYTDKDRYFTPAPDDIETAKAYGIPVHMRPGYHNEVLTDPAAMITGLGIEYALEHIDLIAAAATDEQTI